MNAITETISNFVKQIQYPAGALMILVFAISGLMIILPGQQNKSVAKGFLIGAIVGFVIVAGAAVWAEIVQNAVAF